MSFKVSVVVRLTNTEEAKIGEGDDRIVQKLGCSDKVYQPDPSNNKLGQKC